MSIENTGDVFLKTCIDLHINEIFLQNACIFVRFGQRVEPQLRSDSSGEVFLKTYAFWPCVQNKTISRGYVKKQKLKKKSRKVKLLKSEPYDLKCPIQKGVAGVIQESVLRVTHVRENEKHGYQRFLPDVCLPMLGDDSRIQLTTPENTITYHNALCLSPPNFA